MTSPGKYDLTSQENPTSSGNRPLPGKIKKHGKDFVFPQALEIEARGIKES
jgi:hypothetical protein